MDKIIKQKITDIIVYTDGSYKKKNGIEYCGYGIHFPNAEHIDVSKPLLFGKNKTNQRAELYAIYKALRLITKKFIFDKIHLYTDSMYSINSLTKWIIKWKKNNWKKSDKTLILNYDIIKKIDDKILSRFGNKIKFYHVKSHTNKQDKHSIGNRVADELANLGAMLL